MDVTRRETDESKDMTREGAAEKDSEQAEKTSLTTKNNGRVDDGYR